MDSNQLTETGADLQSAATLQLRRRPYILYTLSVKPIDQWGKQSDINQRSPSVNLAQVFPVGSRILDKL